jgi:phosphoenolpyruvate-protein kinase (PTS system EI component)
MMERSKRAPNAAADYERLKGAIMQGGDIAARLRSMVDTGELFEMFPELKELNRITLPSLFWEGIDTLEHTQNLLDMMQRLDVAAYYLSIGETDRVDLILQGLRATEGGKLFDLDEESFKKICLIYKQATATEKDKVLLWMSALLHDIGKVVFVQDHPNVGLRLLKPILEQYKIDPTRKRMAELLMKHHAVFGELMLAETTPQKVKKILDNFASGEDKNVMLSMLAVINICDMKGVGETGRLFTVGVHDIVRYVESMSDDARLKGWMDAWPEERLLLWSQLDNGIFREVKDELQASLMPEEKEDFNDFLKTVELNYAGHIFYELSPKEMATMLFIIYKSYRLSGNNPLVVFTSLSKEIIERLRGVLGSRTFNDIRNRFNVSGKNVAQILDELGMPSRIEGSVLIFDIEKLIPPAEKVIKAPQRIVRVPWARRSIITKARHLFIPGAKILDIFRNLDLRMYDGKPGYTASMLKLLTPLEVLNLLKYMGDIEKSRSRELISEGFLGIYISPSITPYMFKAFLKSWEHEQIAVSIVDKQTLNIELKTERSVMGLRSILLSSKKAVQPPSIDAIRDLLKMSERAYRYRGAPVTEELLKVALPLLIPNPLIAGMLLVAVGVAFIEEHFSNKEAIAIRGQRFWRTKVVAAPLVATLGGWVAGALYLTGTLSYPFAVLMAMGIHYLTAVAVTAIRSRGIGAGYATVEKGAAEPEAKPLDLNGAIPDETMSVRERIMWWLSNKMEIHKIPSDHRATVRAAIDQSILNSEAFNARLIEQDNSVIVITRERPAARDRVQGIIGNLLGKPAKDIEFAYEIKQEVKDDDHNRFPLSVYCFRAQNLDTAARISARFGAIDRNYRGEATIPNITATGVFAYMHQRFTVEMPVAIPEWMKGEGLERTVRKAMDAVKKYAYSVEGDDNMTKTVFDGLEVGFIMFLEDLKAGKFPDNMKAMESLLSMISTELDAEPALKGATKSKINKAKSEVNALTARLEDPALGEQDRAQIAQQIQDINIKRIKLLTRNLDSITITANLHRRFWFSLLNPNARKGEFEKQSTMIQAINGDFLKKKTPAIVFMDNIDPMTVVYLDKIYNIQGIVTSAGSVTAHGAIFAKNKGIPVIRMDLPGKANFDEEMERILKDTTYTDLMTQNMAIMRSDILGRGEVVISPDLGTVKALKGEALNEMAFREFSKRELKGQCDKVNLGYTENTVELFANADTVAQAKNAAANGAAGIGLVRSEFLFMDGNIFEPEKKGIKGNRLVREYLNKFFDAAATADDKAVARRALRNGMKDFFKNLAAETKGKVRVRVLDFESDKKTLIHEKMKAAGMDVKTLSGLRVFDTEIGASILFIELEALLEAYLEGADNLQILFPMVSEPAEVEKLISGSGSFMERARDFVAERAARAQGRPDRPASEQRRNKLNDMPLGIMIETDKAVANIRKLLAYKEISFYSVGTNDLTRYAMRALPTDEPLDRDEPSNKDILSRLRHRVLGHIVTILEATRDYNREQMQAGRPIKQLGFCGEMASWPEFEEVLVWKVDKLGIKKGELPLSLSMASDIIPVSNSFITRVSSDDFQGVSTFLERGRDELGTVPVYYVAENIARKIFQRIYTDEGFMAIRTRLDHELSPVMLTEMQLMKPSKNNFVLYMFELLDRTKGAINHLPLIKGIIKEAEAGKTQMLLANLFRSENANWIVRGMLAPFFANIAHELAHLAYAVFGALTGKINPYALTNLRWDSIFKGIPIDVRGPPALLGMTTNIILGIAGTITLIMFGDMHMGLKAYFFILSALNFIAFVSELVLPVSERYRYASDLRKAFGPVAIVGIAGNTRDSSGLANIARINLGVRAEVVIVSSKEELAEIAREKHLPAIFIDNTFNRTYAYTDDFRNEIYSLTLAREYDIVLTTKYVSPDTRQKIADTIKELLGPLARVNFDLALKNFMKKQMDSGRLGRIQEINRLVSERRKELTNIYNGMPMPSLAQVNEKNVVIAITEQNAKYNMYAAGQLDQLSRSDRGCAFIYGDYLKTPEEARKFLKDTGYLGNVEDADRIRFINKNDYKDYDGLVAAVRGKNAADTKVGIVGTENELNLRGNMPETCKLLEVQPIVMNNREVYVTIDSVQILLRMMLEGEIEIPGLTKDETGRIFRYLPRTVPIDYEKEIRTYIEAIELIRTAA